MRVLAQLPIGIDVLVRSHTKDVSRHLSRNKAIYDEWNSSNDVNTQPILVSTIYREGTTVSSFYLEHESRELFE
ncbi:hypothetical protein TNCV_972781 [Trichonephila clavipes]|nr:hypothetical protein TNCV_972781 [Trichonephila clavipes]